MKILITGATGFIGSHIAQALAAANPAHHVIALARRSTYEGFLRQAGIAVRWGDLLEPATLKQATEGVDVVIHAAGGGRYTDSFTDLYRLNVTGTANLLEAAYANSVGKFIFISSAAATGNVQLTRPISEEEELPPFGDYGKTKWLAEKECLRYPNALIVRPSTVYGPALIRRRNDEIAGASSTRRIAERIRSRGFLFAGSGKNVIHPCYVKNLVHGVLQLVEKTPTSRIFYLTDQAPIQYRDYVNLVARSMGLEPSRRTIPYAVAWAAVGLAAQWKKLRGEPVFLDTAALRRSTLNYHYDLTRARNELGYAAPFSTEEGLQSTIRSYLEQEGI